MLSIPASDMMLQIDMGLANRRVRIPRAEVGKWAFGAASRIITIMKIMHYEKMSDASVSRRFQEQETPGVYAALEATIDNDGEEVLELTMAPVGTTWRLGIEGCRQFSTELLYVAIKEHWSYDSIGISEEEVEVVRSVVQSEL